MPKRDIIVIGASGGIGALFQLLKACPPNCLRLFIVQHLGDRSSMLAEILSRCGAMKAVQAEDGICAAASQPP